MRSGKHSLPLEADRFVTIKNISEPLLNAAPHAVNIFLSPLENAIDACVTQVNFGSFVRVLLGNGIMGVLLRGHYLADRWFSINPPHGLTCEGFPCENLVKEKTIHAANLSTQSGRCKEQKFVKASNQ